MLTSFATPSARRVDTRDRGFTMVELLVVALVISILTAVGIPVFMRHRANAKLDAVRSDAEQAGLALTAQVTGSGMLPSTLDAQGSGVWGFKPTAPNTVAEYKAQDDRFRICVTNTAASPRVWAYFESATGKVTSGKGTEPTGACDGDTTAPPLAAEPVRGPSTPFPTPAPTAVPTVAVPAPPAPTGVNATNVLGEDRITVSWTAVTGATGYRIYLNGSATPAWSGTNSPAVLSGLANGTYQVRVTARNSNGESAPSSAANVTVDSNDSADNAHTISASIAAASTYISPDHSNATATVQSGETTPDSRSLWWRFTPSAITTYAFTTIAPTDGSASPGAPTVTVWRVPTGSTAVPGTNPTIVTRGAYNPAGSQTSAGLAPLVTVQSGYDYLVRVTAGSVSDTGKFRLRVNRAPSADMLATPFIITQPAVGASTSATNSMLYTGAESGETGSNLSSIWFGMQKTRASDIKLDVSGTGLTPVITVWATSTTNPGSLGTPLRTVNGTSLTLTDAEVAYNQNLRIRVSATGSGTRGSVTLQVSSLAAVAPLPSCFDVTWDGGANLYWDKPDSRVTHYYISFASPYGTDTQYVTGSTTSYYRLNLTADERATFRADTPIGEIPSCGSYGVGY